MSIKEKKIKNPYKYMFFAFLILMIVFFITPLLIKISVIYGFIASFLYSLGNYKEVYISSLGAALGTGLAVSSALYLQKNDSIKNEINETCKKKEFEIDATKNVINWVKRELNMLWGLWVWSTYDISNYGITNIDQFKGHLYFEPYVVNNNLILENYAKINNYLSEEDKEIFLKLYYFAEKINEYIKSYNQLNYDVSMVNSDSPISNQFPHIYSELKKNTSSERYKSIFKYLIKNEEDFLFFSNEREKYDCDTYFIDYKNCNIEYNKTFNAAVKKYKSMKDVSDYSQEPENYIKSFVESKKTEKKFGLNTYIKKIRSINREMEKISSNYKLNREKHYESVDNNIMIGNNLSKLVYSLDSIKESANLR